MERLAGALPGGNGDRNRLQHHLWDARQGLQPGGVLFTSWRATLHELYEPRQWAGMMVDEMVVVTGFADRQPGVEPHQCVTLWTVLWSHHSASCVI